MKLQIVKIISIILSVIGILGIFVFAFTGNIKHGWMMFVICMLVSGLISLIFFRCPHCRKSIPVTGNINQKYCPYCGEDLGMKPNRFSYYSKCIRTKDGSYKAVTTVGPMVFLVSTSIVLMIVVALLGFDSIFKGTGRILVVISFVIGIFLGILCRLVVGSSAKLDEEKLYLCKIPFKWKEYTLEDIKKQSAKLTPFYHVVRGYVVPTSKGIIVLPVASYRGGREFISKFTERIGQPMIDIRPELVYSKRAENSKKDEELYINYMNRNLKEEDK